MKLIWLMYEPELGFEISAEMESWSAALCDSVALLR